MVTDVVDVAVAMTVGAGRGAVRIANNSRPYAGSNA